MAERNEFVEHVVETMRAFGPVEAKAMFGGWGLYHRGAFFALIAGDALYFEVDDENRPRFAARGLEAFVYLMKDGTKLAMNYHQGPEESLVSPPDMAEWARLGYGAALLGHHEGRCSFESILLKYDLKDPALQRMARIVHAADVAEDIDTDPLARGLEAIAAGYGLRYPDDEENLSHQFDLYDALYAWCRMDVARVAA